MVTLSLCMIVKDEQDFLEQCLSSVKGLVDEIIIVDTGSTDNTKDIARKFTSKVYDYKWNDDFSAARNESLKYATGDWILVLDADEILQEKDHSRIKQAIINNNVDAYRLITYNYSNDSSVSGWKPAKDPMGKFSGYYPSIKVRLLRTGKYFFVGALHELVEPSIRAVKGNIAKLDVPVYHYGALKPSRNYVDLAKKKVLEFPSAESHFELGVEYKQAGIYDLAEEAFTSSLKFQERPGTIFNLAIVQQKQKKFDEAITNFSKLSSADSFFGLGFCFYSKGNLKLASEYFLKAAESNPGFLDAYVNLGAVYEKLGKYDMALQALNHALSITPSGRAYYNIGVVYEKLGDVKNAVSSYSVALGLGYNKEKTREILHKLSLISNTKPCNQATRP